MKQDHLLEPCNCVLCSGDSGNYLGKKCPYCKAHAPSQETHCQAADCERVGSEIAQNNQPLEFDYDQDVIYFPID